MLFCFQCIFIIPHQPKNLEDILAELKPTIEFDDGISSGTLSLDHSTIKTEAAGYKSSSYTVTATKNYTGLDRNDSSYDNTVEHTVGEVNGSYWFKVDIGSQEGESNYEEEP